MDGFHGLFPDGIILERIGVAYRKYIASLRRLAVGKLDQSQIMLLVAAYQIAGMEIGLAFDVAVIIGDVYFVVQFQLCLSNVQ